MKRRAIALLLILIMASALGLSGCGGKTEQKPANEGAQPKTDGGTQKPIELRMSHEVPVGHNKDVMMRKLGDLVAERTNGRVKPKLYPSAELYKDADAVQALTLGTLELATPASSVLASLDPGIRALDLPYLITEEAMLDPQVRARMVSLFAPRYEKKGIKLLDFWRTGSLVWIDKQRPLLLPKDIKGLKLRTHGGKLYEETIKTMGGSPITMAASEVQSALSQGVIDGLVTTWSLWDSSLSEIADYGTDAGTWAVVYAIVVNKAWWDGLPADIRDVIGKTITEVTAEQWTTNIEAEKKARKSLATKGKKIHTLTEEERAQWVKATESVRNLGKNEVGAQLLDDLQSLLKK